MWRACWVGIVAPLCAQDVFGAKWVDKKLISRTNGVKLKWSNESEVKYGWERSVVLPLKSCDFEGYPFKSPAKPADYLDGWGYWPTAMTPDHDWNQTTQTNESIDDD